MMMFKTQLKNNKKKKNFKKEFHSFGMRFCFCFLFLKQGLFDFIYRFLYNLLHIPSIGCGQFQIFVYSLTLGPSVNV